jgi:hypothetical protein
MYIYTMANGKSSLSWLVDIEVHIHITSQNTMDDCAEENTIFVNCATTSKGTVVFSITYLIFIYHYKTWRIMYYPVSDSRVLMYIYTII